MFIKTIDKAYLGEYRVMNSKFLGFLIPLSSIEETNNILSKLKKEHPKANHICYAFRYGYHEEYIKVSDDGEPTGTAGKPILNQLYSYELKNCILAIVRYFGGTKLGVSGLIDAYKMTAIATLQQVTPIELEETQSMTLTNIPDASYYKLMQAIKTNSITILSSQYLNDSYELELLVPSSKIDLIQNLI